MKKSERKGLQEDASPDLKAGGKIADRELEKELERIRELEEDLGKPILGSNPFSDYL